MYGSGTGMDGALKKVAAKKAKKKMSKTMREGMKWDKAESTKGFKPIPFISKAKRK